MATILFRLQSINWNEIGDIYGTPSKSWMCLQPNIPVVMMTSPHGNIRVTGGFRSQRPVTRTFVVFFDLRLDKWLSKQSRLRWFQTRLRSLWCHYDVMTRDQQQAQSILDEVKHVSFTVSSIPLSVPEIIVRMITQFKMWRPVQIFCHFQD